MTGWLIVNAFLETEKFQELYRLLLQAAAAHGVTLQQKTTAQLLCPVDSGFAGFALPDFVLFWDKDVYLAQRLEAAGVRCFNRAQAIARCDNKALTAIGLLHAGVRTPRTILAPKTFENIGYCRTEFLAEAFRQLGAPMVIKEAYGSFGQQVWLVETPEQAETLAARLHGREFLMQEFIASSRGRDVRVNVVGGRVAASMLRSNAHDFRSNLTIGGSMRPWQATDAQAEAALRACRALELDFAGVDVLFGEADEPVVCEVNSNPHFKTTLDCTGVDLAACILDHIVRTLA